MRRALDLLGERKDVDDARIGFLGHGYGAAIGGIVSGVDHRFAGVDLLSGGATPSRGYAAIFAGRSKAKRAEYERILRVIDPVRYVRYAAPDAAVYPGRPP
ncbi:MAG: hypothetical protein M3R26_00810 [Actinomycetota bacterium]|nr:hypothetical protein [Actinomycetota bacterium]MDQ2983023.1 hypothetical protein [Actinomycetota bacterium]